MVAQGASVVGTPIPGLPALDVVTTEQDWVVTGVNEGKPFKAYVSPHVTREEAVRAVASSLRLRPDTLEWITAARRDQVERCIRLDSDWLRSRTI